MATMPAESVLNEDGGRSAGEVAPGVTLVKNVRVPVRDGTRLAADVYFPSAALESGNAVSLVMEYIPYRKDEVAPGHRFYEYFPQQGYAVARVDIRGSGASPGTTRDEYLMQEQLDGVDAVEWFAGRPWCTGHVNMMGISYGGFTSLQIASHAPEHLTSIIPMYFTDDRYTDDCHFRGGLMRKYYDVTSYGNMMVAWNALPPYPEWSDDWAEVWQEHLDGNEPYLLEWFRHQVDSDYWANGSVGRAVERVRCPAFLIGGWRDGYPNPPLRLFSRLQCPKKVLVGPWDHRPPDVAVPGPRIDHLHEVVRWLDHWCGGAENGVMDEPAVVVFMQEGEEPVVDRLDSAGSWRAETAWPAPGASERVLHLDANGALAEEPGHEGADELRYDPTVGVTAGLWSGGIHFGLPGDQRPDEALSLTYTSTPLTEDIHVLGRPRAEMHVTSSARVIGFCVSLADVRPDGTSHLVAKGMLNVTRRDSLSEPAPLEPGEQAVLAVDLDTTGWVFRLGHRLRVSVANADWPNVWPTPEAATSEVLRGASAPSHLVLPLVPAGGSATPPEFLPSPVVVERHASAAEPPTWRVSRDVLSGRAEVEIATEGDVRVNDTTLVRRSFVGTMRADRSDPARASAFGRHTARIVRPSGTTTSTSDLTIQATRERFHITLTVEVLQNDAQVFVRHWVESVPRVLL
jgi:putative CocE/NonD family hydrolase